MSSVFGGKINNFSLAKCAADVSLGGVQPEAADMRPDKVINNLQKRSSSDLFNFRSVSEAASVFFPFQIEKSVFFRYRVVYNIVIIFAYMKKYTVKELYSGEKNYIHFPLT